MTLGKAAAVFLKSESVPGLVFMGNILLMFFFHWSGGKKEWPLIKISIVFTMEEGSHLVVVMVISE